MKPIKTIIKLSTNPFYTLSPEETTRLDDYLASLGKEKTTQVLIDLAKDCDCRKSNGQLNKHPTGVQSE